MPKKIKPYEELEFTDNFLFNKILTNDTELCKELLELILQKKIDHLVLTKYEYSRDPTYESRGIRMDVYIESDAGEVFDVEMQAQPEANLPKRCRYYHSALDTEQLLSGSDYSNLKKTYVIFICKNSLGSGYDKPVYTFRNCSMEDPSKILDDDSYTVLVNSMYEGDCVSKDMQDFLRFVRTGEAFGTSDSLAARLMKAVENAVKSGKWSNDYMRMSVELNHQLYLAREEAIKEGLEEGRKKGLEEGRKKGLEEGLREGLQEGREEGHKEGHKEGLREGLREGRKEGLEEGLALERINTEKERLRADAALNEVAELKKEIESLKAQLKVQ